MIKGGPPGRRPHPPRGGRASPAALVRPMTTIPPATPAPPLVVQPALQAILADAAHHHGQTTILTKYGRPYAAIVPAQKDLRTLRARVALRTLSARPLPSAAWRHGLTAP